MIDEKHEVYVRAMRFEDGYEDSDEEMAAAPPRPLPLTHAIIVGLAMVLVMVVFGLSVSTVCIDKSFIPSLCNRLSSTMREKFRRKSQFLCSESLVARSHGRQMTSLINCSLLGFL